MIRNRGATLGALGLCMVAAMFMATPAHAETMWIWQSPFLNVSNNSGLSGSGILLDVGYDGVNAVFRITNNTGTGSITDVYFDLTSPPILDHAAYFSVPSGWDTDPSPSSFQGLVAPAFATQAGSDTTAPGIITNGIQTGGYKDFVVRVNPLSYANVQTALLQELAQGDLRIGIHMQSISPVAPSTGTSDWFVSTVVPLPAAAPIGVLGMGLIGVARVIRRKKS